MVTLRSILSTCEIADAVMQLVFTAGWRPGGSLRACFRPRAAAFALKFGIGVDGKRLASVPPHAAQIDEAPDAAKRNHG
ncbi:MAG: hypothetical protein R3F17_00280 [Planctomycetota bacterium]